MTRKEKVILVRAIDQIRISLDSICRVISDSEETKECPDCIAGVELCEKCS